MIGTPKEVDRLGCVGPKGFNTCTAYKCMAWRYLSGGDCEGVNVNVGKGYCGLVYKSQEEALIGNRG